MAGMGLARKFAQQLARPRGMAGRLIGNAMDLANRRPTRLALDLLDARPGERILDAGCGTGAALQQLLDRVPAQVWGIDPSPAMLAAARARLGDRAWIESATIEDMPFADEGFDAVLALNVLYFADPAGTMIRELHRVLRPGGRLIVYVTDRASMEEWPFARVGIHRLYDRQELAHALEHAGFAQSRICVHKHAITATVDGLLAIATKD